MINQTIDLDIIIYARFEIFRGPGDYYSINIPYLCQRCGNCCKKNAFPDPKCLPRVIEFLEITTQELIERYLSHVISYEKTDLIHKIYELEPCIFFEENECTIYEVRPLLCRKWFPKRFHSSNRNKTDEVYCFTHEKNLKLISQLLNGLNYTIGVWEIIYLDPINNEPDYPLINTSNDIYLHILKNYFFPTETEAKKLWKIYFSFSPTDQEKYLFKLINPAVMDIFFDK